MLLRKLIACLELNADSEKRESSGTNNSQRLQLHAVFADGCLASVTAPPLLTAKFFRQPYGVKCGVYAAWPLQIRNPSM